VTDARWRRSNTAAAEPQPSIPATRADRAVANTDAIMLTHLENVLADAIHLALPTNQRPMTGPMQPPSAADAPLLNIAATRLRPTRKSGADGTEKRVPVDLPLRVTLTGDGQKIKWPFPNHTGKNIIEIELTPGRLARRGDDYLITLAPEEEDTDDQKDTRTRENAKVEDDTLEFRRAPVGPFTVLSRSGTPATGYQECSPCRATIEMSAWGEQASDADDLLTPALAAALTAFIGIDRLELAKTELAQPTGTVYSVRLLNPLVELKSIERVSLPGMPSLVRSTAMLSLCGECELTVALGQVHAEDKIGSIDYDLIIHAQTDKTLKGLITRPKAKAASKLP
jgi:hypothetical protein